MIVDKPDLKGRVNILKVHSKDVRLDETVDFEEIALATSGAVGADLANMMNEAAINAVKNGRQAVSQKDLFEAVELVLVGKEKKDRILSKEERRISPTMRLDTRLSPRFRRMLNRSRRSRSFRVPWERWDMSCRFRKRKNI